MLERPGLPGRTDQARVNCLSENVCRRHGLGRRRRVSLKVGQPKLEALAIDQRGRGDR